jgi:hypothetical protein
MSANRHLEIDGFAGHDDTPEVTSCDGWPARVHKNHVIYFITSHYVHAVYVPLMKYEKWKATRRKIAVTIYEESSGAIGKWKHLVK